MTENNNGELKTKVEELTKAVYELKTKAALTDAHVLNHENTVRDFIARNEQRAAETSDEIREIKSSLAHNFNLLREDNARQTAIISKWGTIRDTLVWVMSVLTIVVGGLWAVFEWLTGHFWSK